MNGPRPPARVTPLRPRRPCPECGAPSSREVFPFCSPRCKDVDLHRWFSGKYAIPAVESEDEHGEDPVAPPLAPRE